VYNWPICAVDFMMWPGRRHTPAVGKPSKQRTKRKPQSKNDPNRITPPTIEQRLAPPRRFRCFHPFSRGFVSSKKGSLGVSVLRSRGEQSGYAVHKTQGTYGSCWRICCVFRRQGPSEQALVRSPCSLAYPTQTIRCIILPGRAIP
jgi:hypothetical protein